MGKVRDIATKVDFESSPTHTVIYDSERDTQQREGRNGEYEITEVVEEGLLKEPALSNQSLLSQLRPLKGVRKIEITRTGASYDTKYTVKDLGPATPPKT